MNLNEKQGLLVQQGKVLLTNEDVLGNLSTVLSSKSLFGKMGFILRAISHLMTNNFFHDHMIPTPFSDI